MFQRILVPLDGSARADQAISVAARLARASGGSIILLQVATIPTDRRPLGVPADVAQIAIEAAFDEAESYLKQIANRGALAGIQTDMQVIAGSVAPTILAVAASLQADLLILCSHGYTGLKRWSFGSVAQKVVRHSPIPVLVLHEDAGAPTNLQPGGIRPVRILVALDGSSLAEEVLAPAVQLSIALSAPAQGALHLVRVLPFASIPEHAHIESIVEVRELAKADAEGYLKKIEQRLHKGDLADDKLSLTSSVVIQPDVAEALISMAEIGIYREEMEGFTGCDVIALATHGRGGFQRWMMGSVAERVLTATRLPLLIVRPQKSEVIHTEAGETTHTQDSRTRETAKTIT